MNHKMVGGRVLFSDSTHLKANANKHKFTREEVEHGHNCAGIVTVKQKLDGARAQLCRYCDRETDNWWGSGTKEQVFFP